jgi:hypothetical protein
LPAIIAKSENVFIGGIASPRTLHYSISAHTSLFALKDSKGRTISSGGGGARGARRAQREREKEEKGRRGSSFENEGRGGGEDLVGRTKKKKMELKKKKMKEEETVRIQLEELDVVCLCSLLECILLLECVLLLELMMMRPLTRMYSLGMHAFSY